MYKVHKIEGEMAEDVEYLGTKRKFWLKLAGKRHLFKAESRGTGEDWAERIACELASKMGIPHVHYELAQEYVDNKPKHPGVICPSMAPRPSVLVHGNQLLGVIDKSYPSKQERKYGIKKYTIEAVTTAVFCLDPPASNWISHLPFDPRNCLSPSMSIFIGYILLDAWIANQDRHHENWAAIWKKPKLELAPTFDHGLSLARNLLDKEREDRLLTRDKNRTIKTFASRARSAFYQSENDHRTLGTLEAFLHFAKLDNDSTRIWLDKLASMQKSDIEHILDKIPENRMTPITKRFTLELLLINKQRILEASLK